MRDNYFKKYVRLVKLGVTTLALVASVAFYSCDDPTEEIVKPIPEKPTDPKEPNNPGDTKKTYIFDIDNMDKLAAKGDSILNISKSTAVDSAQVNILNDLIATADNMKNEVKKLVDADEKTKVNVNYNNKAFLPASAQTMLDSIGTSVLAKVPFRKNGANTFYIDKKFQNIFTAAQLASLGIKEESENKTERDITINANSYQGGPGRAVDTRQLFINILDSAKVSSIRSITFNINYNLEDYIENFAGYDEILANPKIKINNPTNRSMRIWITKHPTPAAELERFWGSPISVFGKVFKYQGAYAGYCAIIPSNKVFEMCSTRRAVKAKSTHPNYVISLYCETEFDEPVFGMFKDNTVVGIPNKTIDGFNPVAADFDKVDMDVEGGGNGAYLMLSGSYDRNPASSNPVESIKKQTLILKDPEKAINFTITNRGKYYQTINGVKYISIDQGYSNFEPHKVLGIPFGANKSNKARINLIIPNGANGIVVYYGGKDNYLNVRKSLEDCNIYVSNNITRFARYGDDGLNASYNFNFLSLALRRNFLYSH